MDSKSYNAELADFISAQQQGNISFSKDHINVLFIDEPCEQTLPILSNLKNFGFRVLYFEKPDDVGEIANKLPEKKSVIITSISFGNDDFSGAGWVEKLKQNHNPVPVIFIGDNDDFKSRITCVQSGGSGFISRPVDLGVLVDKVDRLVGDEDNHPFRILIVDDDPLLMKYTSAILETAGMITSTISDPTRVLEEMHSFAPELVLTDLYMPSCSGIELAELVRQEDSFAGIPIVFLSGEEDFDKQINALSFGGDYFLTKPINPEHLLSAVISRVKRFRGLRSMMVRDSLTGLLNHSTTKQFLENELGRARRAQKPVIFAMIDLDNFKNINDTYGHSVGDLVIKSVARILKQRLRSTDIIGRMGGEEFSAVLYGTTAGKAEIIFNEIRVSFSEIVHETEKGPVSVTLSCGLAEFPKYDTSSKLIEAADRALYQSKESGRNQVQIK